MHFYLWVIFFHHFPNHEMAICCKGGDIHVVLRYNLLETSPQTLRLHVVGVFNLISVNSKE